MAKMRSIPKAVEEIREKDPETCISAVSYTHLDVYKRQALDSLIYRRGVSA